MSDATGDGIQAVDAIELGARPLRYFDFMMAAFVTILLLSNVIGAAKMATLPLFGRDWTFGAGILFFPVSYILGDVLTEVYGYARARRCIWVGFCALIFMAFMSYVVVTLPPAASWTGQPAYEVVFGQVWRIVLASVIAFWAGEFANSFVMARMKIWTRGKHLWSRTWGSTIVGEGVDSLLFYPIAFLGIWPTSGVVTVMITNFALKVGWEVLLTPVTYMVVGFLKRREGLDVFDTGTKFTPFRTKI